MQSSPVSATTPAPQHRPFPGGDLRRGILAGLVPLAGLIVLFAIALALAIATRLVTGSLAFGVRQVATVIALAVGLVLAAVVYAISIVGVYRRMRAWREAGRDVAAAAALWTLAVTALIVLAPVIVAAVLPQHPAP